MKVKMNKDRTSKYVKWMDYHRNSYSFCPRCGQKIAKHSGDKSAADENGMVQFTCTRVDKHK